MQDHFGCPSIRALSRSISAASWRGRIIDSVSASINGARVDGPRFAVLAFMVEPIHEIHSPGIRATGACLLDLYSGQMVG